MAKSATLKKSLPAPRSPEGTAVEAERRRGRGAHSNATGRY
jgi:hypothetical protein